MLGLEPEIEAEYQRILKTFENQDESLGEFSLSISDVLKAHFLIANHFYLEGEGLGGIGPREVGLLSSAISRQWVSIGVRAKWIDRFDVCATLLFGLIKNHPFHDANKRTAFLSVLYQLYRSGWCPAAGEKEFEDLTVEIANNDLGKYSRYKELVKSVDPDPEVKYISYFLRKNTRQVDKVNYAITFRELKAILHRYGYELENPNKNHIDVIRVTKHRPFLRIGPEKQVRTRICRIGFPCWTKQVSKGDIKAVREAAGLTQEKGVDSASFFNGVDPLQSLIASYHAPLMRLANR